MSDQSRNLNAHAAAHMARFIWASRYVAQNGGVMDFWDGLPHCDKRLCIELSDQVRAARPVPANTRKAFSR